MRTSIYKTKQRVFIDPGEYYVSNNSEIITTLLGSCVAACLYDEANQIFGMNHFLLAYRNHSSMTPLFQSEEGRYGMYAMELLINAMLKMGAKRPNLQAKVFGGANVLRLRSDANTALTVGELNSQFIKEYLQKEKIPLVAADLGGNAGRNINFVANDYSVYVRRMAQVQELLVEKEERRYWKQSVDALDRAKTQTKAEFW